MTDLISRDKAVAAVLGTSIEYQLIYGKKEPKEGFVRSLIKSLANIPQEEPEWIPVSERLPVVEEKVLVFQTYDRNCSTTIGYIKAKEYFDNGSYNGGYWVWFITDKNSKSMCQTACPGDEYVKGWMPLPKWEMSNDE